MAVGEGGVGRAVDRADAIGRNVQNVLDVAAGGMGNGDDAGGPQRAAAIALFVHGAPKSRPCAGNSSVLMS